MTPLASVAMLEKLALLKIALCRAPVLSRASVCRTSSLTSVALAVLFLAGSMYSRFRCRAAHRGTPGARTGQMGRMATGPGNGYRPNVRGTTHAMCHSGGPNPSAHSWRDEFYAGARVRPVTNQVFSSPLPRSEEHTSELQSRPYLVCR